MATANSTRRLAGSSLSAQSDEFAALSRRLLVTINQVLLVSQHFGDLADLSPEHVPAGMTLHEAAKDLDGLYNQLDSWYIRREHSGRQVGIGVFKDDGADRSPLAGLPPAMDCPFCGRHDDVMVSQIQADDDKQGPWFRAHCGICGVDAPGDDTALGAAQQWNRRGIDPTSENADEKPVGLGASDNTADRIRAFLMSMRPLSGFAADDDKYQRGRVTIERMAYASQEDRDPDLIVTPQQAADVLNFLSRIVPFEPDRWWNDPEDAPSHVCGLEFVLRTLERSLRSKGAQS